MGCDIVWVVGNERKWDVILCGSLIVTGSGM